MNTVRLQQPKREKANVETVEGLPTRGRGAALKFVYCHYPQSWDFVDGVGFLPGLAKITAMPGVNGVSASGDLSRVLSGVASKGGTYISPSDPRLGEYVGYVQYYETRNGGRWYVDFCQTATVLPTDEILWGTTSPGAFDEFRAGVRDSGIIPVMMVEVFEMLIARENERAEVIAATMQGNPIKTALFEKVRGRITAMQKTWKAGRTPPTKPGKKITKKTAAVEV